MCAAILQAVMRPRPPKISPPKYGRSLVAAVFTEPPVSTGGCKCVEQSTISFGDHASTCITLLCGSWRFPMRAPEFWLGIVSMIQQRGLTIQYPPNLSLFGDLGKILQIPWCGLWGGPRATLCLAPEGFLFCLPVLFQGRGLQDPTTWACYWH